MKKPWQLHELELLKTDASDIEIAAQLSRTATAVQNKRIRLGIPAFKARPSAELEKGDVANSTVAEDLAAKDETYWQRQYDALRHKYDSVVEGESVVDRLVSQISSMAPRSYQPHAPLITVPKTDGQAQSAVLMFSDTHIGKVTRPNQTLSFGRYDFGTFLNRLQVLEKSVASILHNHTATHVPELVIAMLGDMLDGTLSHSNEAGQADPIFNQFYAGAHVIAQFFRNLAAHFPQVRVFDVVGNHTRFQNQKRMPTKNRYSNFDKFLYALVRELTRDVKNILWELDAQPYALFDVQGFTFFAAHGDTLRGGDKALGVPNHAVGRLVSTATQLMNKHNRKAPNYYLMGHLHREISLPHATGSILINGGFPGVDEFGLAEMFTPADPSQKFFLVHPEYGKTATYDISLKHATGAGPAYYRVPEDFKVT